MFRFGEGQDRKGWWFGGVIVWLSSLKTRNAGIRLRSLFFGIIQPKKDGKMTDFKYALVLMTLLSWFAFNMQRHLEIYNGTYREVIHFVCLLASMIGRVLGIAFVIALFFKASFAWYDPLLLVVISFLLSLALDFVHAIFARGFFADFLTKIVSLIGIVVVSVMYCVFIFK